MWLSKRRIRYFPNLVAISPNKISMEQTLGNTELRYKIFLCLWPILLRLLYAVALSYKQCNCLLKNVAALPQSPSQQWMPNVWKKQKQKQKAKQNIWAGAPGPIFSQRGNRTKQQPMGFCMSPASCTSLAGVSRKENGVPSSSSGKRLTAQGQSCWHGQLHRGPLGMETAVDVLSHHWEHSRPRPFVRAPTTLEVEWWPP